MKHIPIHNLSNKKIEIDSQSLADISELIRESDIAARILFLLSAYIDKNNSLITNINTISKMIGKDNNKIKYGLLKLKNEGFIDLEIVNIEHINKIIKYIHDYNLYLKSNRKKWKIIKKHKGIKFKLIGKYIRITINSAVLVSKSKRKNSILLELYNNTLFYDKDLNDNEISSSYWIGDK